MSSLVSIIMPRLVVIIVLGLDLELVVDPCDLLICFELCLLLSHSCKVKLTKLERWSGLGLN